MGCRYAAGATIQIILFGILAVQIKMKAPTAHTVLEIVHARWGNVAHLVTPLPSLHTDAKPHSPTAHTYTVFHFEYSPENWMHSKTTQMSQTHCTMLL